MKKIAVILISSLLVGCASDDLLKNNFPSVIEKKAPESLVGIWTGSTGPYTTTIHIKNDGTGVSCYSWNDKNAIRKVKYDGVSIRFQEGTRLEIKNINSEFFVAYAPYYLVADYVFYKDANLKNASPFYEKQVNK